MNTIVEIQHALRRITPADRQVVASWLEGYQEREADLIGVAEPESVYTMELPYMTLEEYLEFEDRSTNAPRVR